MNRRKFLKASAAAVIAGGWTTVSSTLPAGAPRARKMTLDLRPGSIGVRGTPIEIIDLAHRHGFESVAPNGNYLAKLSNDELQKLLEDLKAKGLVWGAAGLSVDIRRDDRRFKDGLKRLANEAAALSRAGVTRVGTWISPSSRRLTYVQNFRQHARRLREVARVLQNHKLRLGLEYIGPKTLWASNRHPFVHTMAETKDLIAEIGAPNVGFVLDSWHWYTAHESGDDLRSLTNKDIVAVDLNDAPAGIPVDEQQDSRRELPAATGVIDLATFMNVLVDLGYDGPVRAEPFNRKLNEMANEEAVAATAKAMKKAFALIK